MRICETICEQRVDVILIVLVHEDLILNAMVEGMESCYKIHKLIYYIYECLILNLIVKLLMRLYWEPGSIIYMVFYF